MTRSNDTLLAVPMKARLPLASLREKAAASATARAGRPVCDWGAPIDRSKLFTCPTLTPLYYTPHYAALTPGQQLRYNQWAGVCHNEVIAFFEQSLANSVLTALDRRPGDLPADLRETLRHFFAEEAEHTALFRRLNRMSAPDIYAHRDHYIVALPAPARRLLSYVAHRPLTWPMVFWVMLAMEERALDISRRMGRMPPGSLEPHYASVYQYHLQDEARHVQIDWHLIERFFPRLSPLRRRVNVGLLKWVTRKFLLSPRRAATRVVEMLATDFPDLRPRLPEMRRSLAALDENPAYQHMMYSRESVPITFALFNHFTEFRTMSDVMAAYRPEALP